VATGRQASSDAPPFEELARRPNFSETGMMTFLLDPQAKMPNMNLTRFEAADKAAVALPRVWSDAGVSAPRPPLCSASG
jgi:hypothetical protein